MMAIVKVVRKSPSIKNKQRNIDNTILKSFWDLADASDDKRLKGAQQILSTLATKQSTTQCGSERSKELEYVMKRLIRGLASSRKCARHGFATVLTCILRQYRLYTVSDVLKLVNEHLKVVKSEAKSEITGTLFGRVLAFVAIIQSELVKEASSNELNDLVKALLSLRRRKPILRPICGTGLALLLKMMTKEMFMENVWPQIEEELNSGWSECSPDTLLLLVVVVSSKHAGKKLLTEHWHCKKLICKDNLQHFSDIIVKSSTLYQVLHPVCEELGREALEKDDSFFAEFWNAVICDVELPSSNRKLLCVNLATSLMSFISSAEQVKAILSSKLMSVIVHQSSVKHEKIKEAVRQLLAALVNLVSRCGDSDAQMAVLTSLISAPSTVMFDNVTRTKTVSTVISKMNAGACKLLADFLIHLIRGDDIELKVIENDSATIESRRSWAVLTLSMLITHSTMANDTDWQQSIVQFMFAAAFFDIKEPISGCGKPFKVALSDKLRHSLQEAFARSLNKLATFTLDKEMASHNHQSFVDHLHKLAIFAQNLLTVHSVTLPVFEDTALQCWNDMMKTVQNIQTKKSEETDDCNLAFQLLFLSSGFQLFVEPAVASEVLQVCAMVTRGWVFEEYHLKELLVCYKKVSQKNNSSNSSDGDSEPEWVDVLVDLLMSLLSAEQQLTRSIVNIAFALLTPLMTSRGLHLITDVLKPNKNTDEVLSFDDDDLKGVDENDETASIDEAENGADVSESSDNEEEQDDDDDDESDTNMEIDDDVRDTVKTALGDAAAHSDVEEESDFDDDAMFRLDDMLSAAFKSMRKDKKLDKGKELKLNHYKMRCLDLVETFVKHTSSASKLTLLITPLLDVALPGWHLKDSELGNRSCRVLAEIYTSKKVLADDGLSKDSFEDLLSNILQYASKVTSFGVNPSNIIASAFLFVVRVYMDLESKQQASQGSSAGSVFLNATVEILTSQVKDFCLKRNSNVNHIFMQQIFNKRPDVLWPLVDVMANNISSSEVRVFCRTQVCVWLTSLISQKMVQDSANWKSFKSALVSELLKVVVESEADQIKPLYMTQVLNLLHKIATSEECAIEESVKTLLSDRLLILKKMSKDLRSPCNKVAGIFRCRLQPVNNSENKKMIRKQRKEKRDAKLAALTNKRKGSAVSNGKSAAKKAKFAINDDGPVDVKPAEKKTKLGKKTGTNKVAKKTK